MDNILIKIARDYTRTPGPRYIKEGNWSGQKFRQESFYNIFDKGIKENKKIVVDLDGALGYGTSFLEEIFGGLIRVHHLNYKDILDHLDIISKEEPYLIDDIMQYLREANEKSLVAS